jgi:hypothetical protein
MSITDGRATHFSARAGWGYRSEGDHVETGEVAVERTVEPATINFFRKHPRAGALLLSHCVEKARHEVLPDTSYMLKVADVFEGVLADPTPRNDADPVMPLGAQAEARHLWSNWQVRPPAGTFLTDPEIKDISTLRVQGKSYFVDLAAAALPSGALPDELCRTVVASHAQDSVITGMPKLNLLQGPSETQPAFSQA